MEYLGACVAGMELCTEITDDSAWFESTYTVPDASLSDNSLAMVSSLVNIPFLPPHMIHSIIERFEERLQRAATSTDEWFAILVDGVPHAMTSFGDKEHAHGWRQNEHGYAVIRRACDKTGIRVEYAAGEGEHLRK